MKVSYNKFICFFCESIILVSVFLVRLFFSKSEKELQIRVVAILAILILSQSVGIVWKINHRLNSYCILILLTGVFMFGQHLLFLVGMYPDGMILLTERVSQQAIYNTGFLVLYSIIIMNMGYIISCYSQAQEQRYTTEIKDDDNRLRIYQAGLLFFAISFFPTIITLSRNIILTFTVGYGERIVNSAYQLSGLSNISGILSSFMVPALIAMFIGRKPGQKFPIIAIGVYMMLYILSGSRINTVILLIGTLYIQNMLFVKMNFRKLLKYGVFAIIVLLVLSTVSVARQAISSSNPGNTTVIKDSIEEVIDNNIIVSSVSEAGYTFSATAVVVDRCPGDVDYKYGMSYVRSLAYILPNGFTGNFYAKVGSADDMFKGYLNPYGSGIGSSFIAEAYWNFGYFSLIVIFLFGLLLGKLSSALDIAIANRKYVSIFLLSYIFMTVSFYVRSETSTFFRNIVWFGLPIIMIADQFKKKKFQLSKDNK